MKIAVIKGLISQSIIILKNSLSLGTWDDYNESENWSTFPKVAHDYQLKVSQNYRATIVAGSDKVGNEFLMRNVYVMRR